MQIRILLNTPLIATIKIQSYLFFPMKFQLSAYFVPANSFLIGYSISILSSEEAFSFVNTRRAALSRQAMQTGHVRWCRDQRGDLCFLFDA